jgi:dTDP-4-dehydrorhamnose 3,5-epimerase
MTEIRETSIAGLRFVRMRPHLDERGAFARIADLGILRALEAGPVAQLNHSLTESVGAVRGLHMQSPPDCGWKMVVCLKGRIWDLALDLRSGSPTFRKWHGTELRSMDALSIPPGCAHGFQVLEGPAELLYLMSESYRVDREFRVNPMDPSLEVRWPLPVALLSDADRSAPFLPTDFAGVSP